MNPHFFTAPFYFAFIWFRVEGSRLRAQGSRFRVQGSGFRVQGCGGGFAANKDGRCPKVVFKLQVTSYKSLGTPNP